MRFRSRASWSGSDLIVEDCLDVLLPDAAPGGSLTGLRRVALMAQEDHLVFTPYTETNGMGIVANAHLAAACATRLSSNFPMIRPMGCGLSRLQDGRGLAGAQRRPYRALRLARMGYDLATDRLASTRIA